MPGPSTRTSRISTARRIALALGVALALTAPAFAQTLDLDGPGAFGKDADTAVDAQIKALRAEIKTREARTGASPQEPADAALVSLRRLALAMLEAGHAAGEAGSVHVLAARRLIWRLVDADAALVGLARGPDPDQRERLARFVRDCPKQPAQVPADPKDLDALLARLLGPLARNTGARRGTGWLIVGADPAQATSEALRAALDGAAPVPGVSKEALAALAAFDAELSQGGPAGSEAAAAQRQIAASSATAVAHAPKWLPGKSHDSIASAFDAGAIRLGAPDTRDAAMDDLARLSLLGDVLARVDETRLTAHQARTLRGLAARLAEAMAPGNAANDDVLRALRRGLMLVRQCDDARWADDRRIVREVRPAWRQVEAGARVAREELIETLSRLEPGKLVLSDPGLLAALTAVSDRLADGRRLCIISEWLAGGASPRTMGEAVWSGIGPRSPEAKSKEAASRRDPLSRQAGARMLALGQQLVRHQDEDAALESIRSLADGLASWMPIRGEDDLQAAAAVKESDNGKRWNEITGGGADDIARAVRVSREAWLNGWAGVKEKATKGRPAESAAATGDRIDSLRRIVELADDTATVMAMSGGDARAAGAQAWPGFALSPDAISAITRPVAGVLARASGMVLASEYGKLDELVKSLEENAEVVETIARLQRAALEHGVQGGDILAELGAPPAHLPMLAGDFTPRTWLIEQRITVATLCRSLEEYATPASTGDRDRAATLLSRMAADAQRLNASLR